MSNNWQFVNLEDVQNPKGRAIVSGPFGSNIGMRFFVPEGIPVIRGNNLTTDMRRFVDDGFVFITEEKAKELGNCEALPGDLIFTAAGSLGQVGIIPDKPKYPRYIISNKQLRVRLNPEKVDKLFVFYWLSSPQMVEHIQQQNTGSTVPLINLSILRKLPLPLPPLPEQRAIAGILGALDDKIELNRRMNATLESMARAMFRQWFVEGEGAKEWKESSLEEIFGNKSDCVLTGPFGSHLHAHDYREEGTPLILVKHVMDGHILEDRLPLVGEHKLLEMKRYLLEVGDIVFTRVGAVGRSAYIHPRHKGWLISGQTLRVRVPDKKKLNPRFLAQIYLEQSFIDMVEQHALGTTRPSLNTSILSSFKFVLPPIELQTRFAEFAEALDNKVQQNLDESRTLASLRDSLLPKLMRGHVRVKV